MPGVMRASGPRNAVWESDYYPKLSDADYFEGIGKAPYTHFITGFLHVADGLALWFNDKPIEDLAVERHWDRCRKLQTNYAKKVVLGMGGWNSGSWARIQSGGPEQAAGVVAALVIKEGFAGVDVNFEGTYSDPGLLNAMASFVVFLRTALPNTDMALTPMYGQVGKQLDAIDTAAAAHGQTWLDVLSCVNVQFYSYGGPSAYPMSDVADAFESLVGTHRLTRDKIGVGFPLEDLGTPRAEAFNTGEVQTATGTLNNLVSAGGIAGAFVWHYQATKVPTDLQWAAKIAAALHLVPAPPTNVRVIP
jgi:hypothetical protein